MHIVLNMTIFGLSIASHITFESRLTIANAHSQLWTEILSTEILCVLEHSNLA